MNCRLLLIAVALVGLSACGDSPTTPSPTTPAPTPQTPSDGLISQTFPLPVGATRMHVVGQTLSGSCHTFRILIDQKPLVEETLGSCTGASGLTYDKTHAFAGRLAEVRTTPLNGTFVWWFTTE